MRIKNGLARFIFAALTVAVSAASVWAAGIAPLNFNGIDEDQQQKSWNYLMGFKLWGESLFESGRATMPNESGWNGTANGNYVATNNGIKLGGAILIGGDIDLSNNGTDISFTSGPIRTTGEFKANIRGNYAGKVCVHAANQAAYDGVAAAGGKIRVGDESAHTDFCIADSVPEVRTDLTVPVLLTANTSTTKLSVNGTNYINVPPDFSGKNQPYDVYLDEISMSNEAHLYIRMPYGGRLTRIFVKKLSFGTHPNIQVQYISGMRDEGTGYGLSDGVGVDPTIVDNKDYAGNVLFYVENDIEFKNTDNTPIQGTFISTGTIKMVSNMDFAGQLIADKLILGNEIKGENFNYVPFDPPVVTAREQNNKLFEGKAQDTIQIVLNKATSNLITFDYCFEITGNDDSRKGDGQGLASLKDFETSLPLYEDGVCKNTRSAKINIGDSALAEPIVVKLVDDKWLEDDESFIMHVVNLKAAVLENKKHEGPITFVIIDNDGLPRSTDNIEVVGEEDTPLPITSIPAVDVDDVALPTFSIKISALPDSASLYLNDKLVKLNDVISSADLVAGKFTFVSEPDKYNSELYTTFKYYVISEYGMPSEKDYSIIVKINPVNDAPVVTSKGFTIPEHGVKSEDRIATGGFNIEDPDDDQHMFKFDDSFDASNTEANYKKVNELYEIDPDNGTISVRKDVDLNYESADSVLYIRVVVSDFSASTGDLGDIEKDTLTVAIRMIDVNEDPSIDDTRKFEVPENSGKGVEVLPAGWDREKDEPKNPADPKEKGVIASDPDRNTVPYGQLTYSIVTPDVPFVINPTTGVITVAEGADLDFEDNTKNSFDIVVKVTDGGDPSKNEAGKSATKTIHIDVSDVNEEPRIVKDKAPNYDQKENAPENVVAVGTLVKEWEILDEDSYDIASTMVLTLEQVGYDAVKDAGKVTVNDLFELVAVSREGKDGARDSMFVKLQVKDVVKLDHEKIMETWGDSVFKVVIRVADKEFSDTLQRTLTIRDVNETPSITDTRTFTIAETVGDNPETKVLPVDWKSGDADYVMASDPDRAEVKNGQYVYSIADNPFFEIDSKKGVITRKKDAVINYEDPSLEVIGDERFYKVMVTVTDKGAGTLNDSKEITIKITNKNEEPYLVKDDETNYPIAEHVVKLNEVTPGTLINEWEVVDVDEGDDLSNLKFTIDHGIIANGVFKTIDESGKVALNTLFELKTEKRDGKNGDRDSMFVRLVVSENISKLDHELVMKDWQDSAYLFRLTVKDVGGLQDTLIRKVTIRDVNERPSITDKRTFAITETTKKSQETKVLPENWKAGEPDYVMAADPDRAEVNNGKYTYSIATNPFFDIDPNTGVITRKNGVIINYEDKIFAKDDDGNKIYKVKVTVTDKGEKALSGSKTITIKIINLNDEPEIDPECDPLTEKCGPDPTCDPLTEKCDYCDATIAKCDDICDPTVKVCNPDPGCVGPQCGYGKHGDTVYVSVKENTPVNNKVFEYLAFDEDGFDNMSVSFVDVNGTGADTLFRMDGSVMASGESYKLALVVDANIDYESVEEMYTLFVIASDGEFADTIVRYVKIIDVNEAPSAEDLKDTIPENLPNGTVVGTVVASDPDIKNPAYSTLTYKVVEDGVPFAMKDGGNQIVVTNSAALNYEKDSIFVFHVEVTDGETTPAISEVTIQLSNEPEDPVIIPDPVCDENKENCHKCDPTKEVCTPITVCDATIEKCDEICDPTKDKCEPDPTCKEGQCGYAVNKDTVYISVNENSPAGYKILEYYVEDEDFGDLESMKVTFIDGSKTHSDSLFAITNKLTTDASGSKFTLTVGDDALPEFRKLDYEAVDELHKLLIVVTDKYDLADTIVRFIKIIDVNEAPSAEDLKDTIPENLPNGTVVGTVVASDPDIKTPEYHALTYKVVEDGVPFAMKDGGNQIVVTNSAALNYEKDSIFVFHVEVTDGATTPAVSEVTIQLSNEPEDPVIIPDPKCDENDKNCHKCDESKEDCTKPCDAMVTDCDKPVPPEECIGKCKGGKDKDGHIYVNIPENSPKNTVVLEYLVEDEDFGDVENLVASFTQTAANKSGADTLFKAGIKNVGTEEKPEYKVYVYVSTEDLDYEKVKPTHEITLIVTDPKGLQDTVIRTINVIDVNEPPFVVKKTFDFDEHNEVGSVVDTVKWGDDKDTKQPAFRDNKVVPVAGDTALFNVDSVGVITTKKKFNYEDDASTYTLVVKVVDRNEPDLYVQDTMTIILNNLPEIPKITTTEFEIPENVPTATEIGVIQAKDPDGEKEILTFKLLEPSEFVTVTEDGTILVKDSTKFDHETTDAFTIKVSVRDTSGMTSDTLITIKITDVNERPTLVDQTVTVPEDTKVGTVVDTVKAKDPDTDPKYSTLTYTVVGGDSATFTVDPKTGEVTLIEPLDYESKDLYKLVVEVDDGEFRDTATVTIKVGDVKEESKVDIILVENPKQTWHYPDTIYTNIPDNVVTWVQDGDTLSMDTTLHDGPNVIIIEYLDPKKDTPGRDTVVIYYSNATPVVTVSAGSDPNKAGNIYTIVEKTDKADTNIYVKTNKNDIVITVKDSAARISETVTVSVELDAVDDLPKDNFTSIANSVAGEVLLNVNPSSTAKYTAVNSDEVKVTYVEKVNGKEVEVSYMITKEQYDKVEKGASLPDPKKTEVVGDDGKVESIEVITVSYNVEMGGKVVTLSYQADAATGEVLVKDADGRLMTTTAVENHNKKVTSASANSSSSAGSSSSSNGSSSNGNSDSKNPSSSGSSSNGSSDKFINAGMFTVTYEVVSDGKHLQVSYVADEEGDFVKNSEGDAGYSVSYTYTNKFGNTSSQSVFIVVDQVGPKVEILYPSESQVIQSNSVTVKWTVNGVVQDTLNVQGLEKGVNAIVRFYRDKAGNEASDTVFVVMKDGKDVEIAVEQPVVVLTQEKVDEYYAANPPKAGQTFGVSLRNPTTGEEAETLIGGEFKTTAGSGKTPYPGVDGAAHLGPTLSLDVKMPVISDIGGMATLDDLISSDGWVALDGVDADNSDKIRAEDYVDKYCVDGFEVPTDMSKANLYNSKMEVHIWIYTTLGTFVDYYSFTQDLNDPRYADEAGLLQMFFEMKPDKNGDVRSESGKLYATGSYLYKVEVSIRSELLCTLPPVKDEAGKKKGDVIKADEELLKPFGYKRPQKKK